MSRQRTLGQDIRGGLAYAAGFSVLALAIIAFAAIGNATGAHKVTGWDVLPLGLPLIILGYFVAGTLASIAFWLIRPLRRWLVGWMLTGFVIAALVYGAIGVTGVLGYYVGANLLDLESAAEGWQLLPLISLITGVFPGIPLGIYYWYKSKREQG